MTGSLKQSTPARTVHQILDKDGNPYEATVTSNLWVSDPGRFSDPTEGNKVQAFVTGKSYFADLLKEVANAKSQILIAGWQINWDALLAPGIRLYDALYRATEKNPELKIYVMPWDEHEPLQTYDDQTAAALNIINERLKRQQVFVQLSPTYASTDRLFFSHHQKQVVIDGRIGYVGGMDLAYGRYCDEHYTLKADADGRHGLNRYNPCVAQIGEMPQHLCADPDLLKGAMDNNLYLPRVKWPGIEQPPEPLHAAAMTKQRIHEGGWQPKYQAGDSINDSAATVADTSKISSNRIDPTTLDSTCQPRMPWQDVHCRIEGPAVVHLMRNFLDRWNIKAPAKQRLDQLSSAESQGRPGNAHVQVLRSAPANHCHKEYISRRHTYNSPIPQGPQTDIQSAMLKLIEKSRRFIYIENQFFVSDFGKEVRPNMLSPAAQFINQYGSKDQNSTAQNLANIANETGWKIPDRDSIIGRNRTTAIHPPTNRILPELLTRIKRSALSNSPFHLYITLPVHPEGCLNDAAIVTQVYWTMQTISFGTYSLLNGVRRIIKARALKKARDRNFERVFAASNNEYETISMDECKEFVTLLNLRNWSKIGDHYVTEQIYVHSKVMIVDDLYALIGSANINDRSLLGQRDSELAVLVMDEETITTDIYGDGKKREARKFAHDLRKQLWAKIFGINQKNSCTSRISQAVEHPGAKRSQKIIQQQAEANRKIYESLFKWLPRNESYNQDNSTDYGHILPTWDNTIKPPKPEAWQTGYLSSSMPFQSEFWSNTEHLSTSTKTIASISGYTTELPIYWTKNENNRFDFPSTLVAKNNSSTAVSNASEKNNPIA